MYNAQMKEKMVRIDLSTFTKLIQIYLSYPFLLKNQLNSSFSLDTGPCSNLGHGQCHCSKAHFSHSTILVGASGFPSTRYKIHDYNILDRNNQVCFSLGSIGYTHAYGISTQMRGPYLQWFPTKISHGSSGGQ